MDKISDVTSELQTLNELTDMNNSVLHSMDETLSDISVDVSNLYGMLLDTSSSSLEDRREQRRQNERMLAALEGQGAGGGSAGASGKKDDKKGGGLLGGLAGGVGGAVVGFGRGMASLGPLAPKIVLGAGAIGTAIGLIGAGIAGAAWLTGKAFPTFVEGLKSFEEVDGKSLEEAGDGLKSLGIGIAAWGAGQISAGVGNLVSGIFGDGMDDMMSQLETFGQAEINTENVKRNAEAMSAFGKAMAMAGGGTAAGGIGTFVSSVVGGIGNFFGGGDADPLSQLKDFGETYVNAENVKRNAEAMSVFGKAMSTGAAGITTGGLATFVSGVMGGIGEVFGGEQTDPLSQLKLFGATAVDLENVENNAKAMSAFAKATSIGAAGTAVGGIGTFVSGVFGGIGEAFGGEQSDPLSQLKLFGETAVNRDNVENNAKAMTAFSGAMALGGAAMVPGGIGTFVNGVMGGIGEFFGGQSSDPIGELMRFGERRVDRDAVENNAAAMKAFSSVMPGGAAATAATGMGTFVNGLVGGLGKLFGGEDPIDQLQRFGERRVNLENVQNNAKAMAAFSNALSGIRSVDTTEALSMLGDNMGVAIPLIDALANGGKYNTSGYGKSDFGEGILDPSLNLDQVAEKIKQARAVFEGEASDAGISELSTDRRPSGQLNTAAAERQNLQGQQSGGGAVNVQSNTSNNVTNNSQTVVKPVEGPTRPPRTAKDTQFAVAP